MKSTFAVSRCSDDQIDTNLLYPILVRSGLSRETLGHIWALCNRITPGQLLKEELFLILAMVALAQVSKMSLYINPPAYVRRLYCNVSAILNTLVHAVICFVYAAL